MIRALLADLFPTRAQVGALRARVHELERDSRYLTHEYNGAVAVLALREAEIARLTADVDALTKRALRPDPTPSEARMLAIVRANPGADSMALGTLMRFPDGEDHSCLEDYAGVSRCAGYLTALHKKGLVRREKAGNTYRYWSVE